LKYLNNKIEVLLNIISYYKNYLENINDNNKIQLLLNKIDDSNILYNYYDKLYNNYNKYYNEYENNNINTAYQYQNGINDLLNNKPIIKEYENDIYKKINLSIIDMIYNFSIKFIFLYFENTFNDINIYNLFYGDNVNNLNIFEEIIIDSLKLEFIIPNDINDNLNLFKITDTKFIKLPINYDSKVKLPKQYKNNYIKNYDIITSFNDLWTSYQQI
jgi:hypothetical protein